MSQSKPVDNTSVGLGTTQWLQNNKYALQSLPEPGKEWLSMNQPEEIQNRIQQLSNNDVIHRKRMTSADKTVFVTNPRAYKKLQEYINNTNTDGYLPCGHDGFKNLGNGTYECLRDVCGQVWTRKDIEKHNE
jgi:hypothetical protein